MLRFASLFCNVLLAVLSLLPGRKMVRAGLRGRASALATVPNRLEHFIAYAGAAAVTMGGFGDRLGPIPVIGFYSVYSGTLEYLQRFPRGRDPSIGDFAVSALGACCGALAANWFLNTTVSELKRPAGGGGPVEFRFASVSRSDHDAQQTPPEAGYSRHAHHQTLITAVATALPPSPLAVPRLGRLSVHSSIGCACGEVANVGSSISVPRVWLRQS